MSETKRRGPEITIKASCKGCEYERSTYYSYSDDDDWGYEVSCVAGGVPREISGGWDTPDWCPLVDFAVLRARIGGAELMELINDLTGGAE